MASRGRIVLVLCLAPLAAFCSMGISTGSKESFFSGDPPPQAAFLALHEPEARMGSSETRSKVDTTQITAGKLAIGGSPGGGVVQVPVPPPTIPYRMTVSATPGSRAVLDTEGPNYQLIQMLGGSSVLRFLPHYCGAGGMDQAAPPPLSEGTYIDELVDWFDVANNVFVSIPPLLNALRLGPGGAWTFSVPATASASQLAGIYQFKAFFAHTDPDEHLPDLAAGDPAVHILDSACLETQPLEIILLDVQTPKIAPLLRATPRDRSMELKWDRPYGAMTFDLYRRADGEPAMTRIQQNLTTRHFDDNTVVGQRFYTYSIVPVNPAGEGPASSPVRVRAGRWDCYVLWHAFNTNRAMGGTHTECATPAFDWPDTCQDMSHTSNESTVDILGGISKTCENYAISFYGPINEHLEPDPFFGLYAGGEWEMCDATTTEHWSTNKRREIAGVDQDFVAFPRIDTCPVEPAGLVVKEPWMTVEDLDTCLATQKAGTIQFPDIPLSVELKAGDCSSYAGKVDFVIKGSTGIACCGAFPIHEPVVFVEDDACLRAGGSRRCSQLGSNGKCVVINDEGYCRYGGSYWPSRCGASPCLNNLLCSDLSVEGIASCQWR